MSNRREGWGAGVEVTYCDLGNMIHFSFFTTRFFTPCLKITIPKRNIKKEKEFFFNRETSYFATTIRNNLNPYVSCFMRIGLELGGLK